MRVIALLFASALLLSPQQIIVAKKKAAPSGIAVVAHPTPVGVSSGTATTAEANTTGATLLLVYAAWIDGAVSTSPTISDSKTNTWTPLTSVVDGGGSRYGQWFYSANPTVGSGHTFSGVEVNNGYITIFPSAWSGVPTTSPYDSQQAVLGVTAQTTIQPGSVTPTADGHLIVTGVSEYNGGTDSYSINSGFTILDKYVTAEVEGGAVAYLVQSTAAAVNPTWTSVSATKAGNNAVFKDQ